MGENQRENERLIRHGESIPIYTFVSNHHNF